VTEPVAAERIVARLRAAGCVFAEDEAALLLAEATTSEQLDAMVELRASGQPLEHVLGWADFHGLRVVLDPGVFVPRRRSEHLVDEAVALAGARHIVLVDLCCGSGAIGLAIATAVTRQGGHMELYAADVDPAAVACARRNLDGIGTVYEGDLFGALPDRLRGTVELLVASAPYVPTDEIRHMPAEARLYEPPIALDGGADGLAVYRRIVADACTWLTPHGAVLIETGAAQTAAAVPLVEQFGFETRVSRSADETATVVLGRRGRAWAGQQSND
jgi:release factor glutamine methyltransferase